MCERYVLPDQSAAEREFLPVRAWWKFEARFNVAARQYVPAIRLHDGQTEAVMMRWGLIPSWAEGKPGGEPAIGADVDQIERSDLYRTPWRQGQRCILPIKGFYAWQLTEARYRQPFFIRLIDRSVFAVAAIWDRSVSEQDDVIESCSVIRVPANDLLASIANTEGRMPAILRRRDYETWLRGTPAEARAALKPFRSSWMQAHPVSPRVNSTVPDDSGLIRPAH